MFCCGVDFYSFTSCRFIFTEFTGKRIRNFFTDFIITVVDRVVGNLIKEHGELVGRENTEIAPLHG